VRCDADYGSTISAIHLLRKSTLKSEYIGLWIEVLISIVGCNAVVVCVEIMLQTARFMKNSEKSVTINFSMRSSKSDLKIFETIFIIYLWHFLMGLSCNSNRRHPWTFFYSSSFDLFFDTLACPAYMRSPVTCASGVNR
jgi:hypothetical protein